MKYTIKKLLTILLLLAMLISFFPFSIPSAFALEGETEESAVTDNFSDNADAAIETDEFTEADLSVTFGEEKATSKEDDDYSEESMTTVSSLPASDGTTVDITGSLPGNADAAIESAVFPETDLSVTFGEEKAMPKEDDYSEESMTTVSSLPASDGTTVDITGSLPGNAVAAIETAMFTEADLRAIFGEEKAASIRAFFAYDIKILVNDEEWQPDGEVAVTVNGLDIALNQNEKLTAAHIDSTTGNANEISAEIIGEDEVCFYAEGFSIYVFAVECIETNSAGRPGVSPLPDEAEEQDTENDIGCSEKTEPAKVDDKQTENTEKSSIKAMNPKLSGQLMRVMGEPPLSIDPPRELDGDYAYIKTFTVESIEDGIGNFDTATNIANVKDANGVIQTVESPGNDASNDNRKVRTYDSIIYHLKFEADVYTVGDRISKGTVFYRFILPLTADKAEWDVDSMNWLQNATVTEEEINNVMCQVLTGERLITPNSGNNTVFPGFGTVTACVKILKMHHGEQVMPTFQVWLDHNCLSGVCSEHHREEVFTLNTDFCPISVTCAPKYNVQLKNSMGGREKGNYDFTTGNSNAMDKSAGEVYGRAHTIGITLQLYNDRPDKGLLGLEIPTGPISFDLDLATAYTPKGTTDPIDVSEEYAPLIWGWGPQEAVDTDVGGRNLRTNGNPNIASDAAPFNSGGTEVGINGSTRCKDGGTWNAVKDGNTIHFTVSGYTIDAKCFPNTDAGAVNPANPIYYNPSTSGYNGIENIGCFSAGKLYIVVPFNDKNGVSVTTKYPGQGDGTFTLQIEDYNLRAAEAAECSDVSNQMNQGDDELSCSLSVATGGGAFSQFILWSTRDRIGRYDVFNRQEFHENGLDWQMEGGNIAITWGSYNDKKGDEENKAIATKSLMKFDPAAVAIDGAVEFSHKERTLVLTVLYAAKQSGHTWTDDAEMVSAKMEDLVYYPSLSALEADNKICIGILFELDPLGTLDSVESVEAITNNLASVPVTVKEGSARLETYMCTAETRVWRLSKYRETPRFNVPSLNNNDPDNPTVLPRPSDQLHPEYEKTVYSGGGGYLGHTGTNRNGDSLLVIGTKAKIRCQTVQMVNVGGVQEPKSKYDMDYFERVADFGLYPRLTNSVDVDGNDIVTPKSSTETVMIQDILPAGLRYISGSAYYGGTYIQNAKEGRQGTVSGGMQMEPTITTDQTTGTQTLTWVIEDVTVAGDMPPIYFSAFIGTPNDESTDVKDKEHLNNTATISATGDCRAQSLLNGNISEKEIVISKLILGSLMKIPDEEYVESAENGIIGYTLIQSNLSSSSIESAILDTLPCNGDSCGSIFTGSFTVENFSINKGNQDITGWEAYYTTDTSARETLAKDYTKEEIQSGTSFLADGSKVTWIEAEINSDGNVPELRGKEPTAIIIFCSIGGNERFEAHLELKKSLVAKEKYVNTLSCGNLMTQAKVEVISRSLEGCLWIDEDRNGSREAAETLPSGIKVSLLKQDPTTSEYNPVLRNGQPVTCTPGIITDIITGTMTSGEAGHYMFTGLPAGIFAVRFEGTSIDFSSYEVTQKEKAGVPERFNSNAVGYYENGVLQYTQIDGIVMKTKAELVDNATYTFDSQYNDSGIYRLSGGLRITKTVQGDLGDKTKQFAFTVVFNAPGRFNYAGSVSGTIASGESVLLKHGDMITIANLPAGTTYTVTEPNSDGYTVTATGATGTIAAGEVSVAAFTNTKSTWPKTGDNSRPELWCGIAATSLIGLVVFSWSIKKKRKN